jgi:cytochrome c oxidase subunit IV
MTEEHVTSPAASFVVFVVLLVLLVLTVVAAGIEHAVLGIVVALTIAVVKAALIVYYFMNVRFADTVTRLFVVAAFFWLLLLLVLMMADYVSRDPRSRDAPLSQRGAALTTPAPRFLMQEARS